MLAFSDVMLPRAEQVEPLIRREKMLSIFQPAPHRFCLIEIVKNFDA